MKTHNGFITELAPNQIFVFGSNLSGIHGAGAAKLAKRWGAKNGQGEGLMGQTYALPTVKEKIRGPLPLSSIQTHVDKFFECVIANPDLEFLLTEVGCGLAGHTVEEIAPLFKGGVELVNIVWAKKFVAVLEK
jgi:hypothetical protein